MTDIYSQASSNFSVGLRLIAKSYQNFQSSEPDVSKLYGTVETGAIPDLSVTPVNFKERATCIEFRCGGVAFDDKTLVRNLTTHVFIIPTDKTCRFVQ